MTARELERNGITTVIIGSAMDIVTWCNVPRYLHNNLPLGNPLGPPGDRKTQKDSATHALALARDLQVPDVVQTNAVWPGGLDWVNVYNRVDDSNREQLLAMGEENRRKRLENKAQGLAR